MMSLARSSREESHVNPQNIKLATRTLLIIRIFIIIILKKNTYLRETRLDDEFGALVAGKESHVDPAAIERGRVLVHDGLIQVGGPGIYKPMIQKKDTFG